MKRVVSLDELAVSDLNQSAVYGDYLKLLESDIAHLLTGKIALSEMACPGCGQSNAKTAYQRLGLSFKICESCLSHYVSPRPDEKGLSAFYEQSKAAQYWRAQVVKDEAHFHHIYEPRVNWIRSCVDEFISAPNVWMDVQSKYPVLISLVQKEQIFKQMVAVDQFLFEQAKYLPKEIALKDRAAVKQGRASVITAFEVIERASDLNALFSFAAKTCEPGGLFLATTASSSGFEYQVLREHATNINPINRMNLLSIEAIEKRFLQAGFEIIELSTPGRLDAEIVKKAMDQNPKLPIDPFWKYFFQKRFGAAIPSLQEFLQLNRLSSHVRIAARKKG